jgi:hypothetical protein
MLSENVKHEIKKTVSVFNALNIGIDYPDYVELYGKYLNRLLKQCEQYAELLGYDITDTWDRVNTYRIIDNRTGKNVDLKKYRQRFPSFSPTDFGKIIDYTVSRNITVYFILDTLGIDLPNPIQDYIEVLDKVKKEGK